MWPSANLQPYICETLPSSTCSSWLSAAWLHCESELWRGDNEKSFTAYTIYSLPLCTGVMDINERQCFSQLIFPYVYYPICSFSINFATWNGSGIPSIHSKFNSVEILLDQLYCYCLSEMERAGLFILAGCFSPKAVYLASVGCASWKSNLNLQRPDQF